jgi:hypothetical protein
MMDNVQNCDSYFNIPSAQTYRSYATECLIIIRIVERTHKEDNYSGERAGIAPQCTYFLKVAYGIGLTLQENPINFMVE